jgi:hypothetical protein
VRVRFAGIVSLALVAVLAAGCGSHSPKATPKAAATTAARPTCAYRAGWQALANRIAADVYCPGWLPGPLDDQIGGQWSNINNVTAAHSYLESFIWQDTDSPGLGGLYHVILRGYPGETKIPTCMEGLHDNVPTPCFANPEGTVVENGIRATFYTVNQDADAWHIALLWRHAGGLYTISEHLAPPADTYASAVANLKRELAALVLIAPTRST